MGEEKIFNGAVRITEKKRVCDETVSIRMEPLRGSMPRPMPGQFGMLTLKAPGWEIPRQRPFSFSGPDEMTVRVAYADKSGERVPGPVSSYIVNGLNEGDSALLRGPLGNSFSGFNLDADFFYLIGGGCGIPPLYYFARELRGSGKKFVIMNGARTRGSLVMADDLYVITAAEEGGPAAERGKVTDLMKRYVFEPGSVFCICGPRPMLKPAAEEARKYSDPGMILISTEERMECGSGVCNKCAVGPYNSCTDGPVFRYSDIMDADFFVRRTAKSGKRVPV